MTSLLCLPPRITGQEAARHFARPRLKNLYGLLSRPVRIAQTGAPDTRVLPFVERFWMPAYAICLHAVSPQKEHTIWTSVDGCSGHFSLFERIEQLDTRDLQEAAFPPTLEEERAVELARKGLLQFILRQRGQFNKPVIDRVEEIRLYHFPVWTCYYRRWKRLDIKVLDAYTGKSAGARTRVAVLNALVAARKARLSNAAPAE